VAGEGVVDAVKSSYNVASVACELMHELNELVCGCCRSSDYGGWERLGSPLDSLG